MWKSDNKLFPPKKFSDDDYRWRLIEKIAFYRRRQFLISNGDAILLANNLYKSIFTANAIIQLKK